MAARKGVAMKPKKTHNKLISRRAHARNLAAIQQNHAWFFQGKPLDIRPGWVAYLDSLLDKIKTILTVEEPKYVRLEYLYCDADSRLRLFADTSSLSEARRRVIEHLIEKAKPDSETICSKCGISFTKSQYLLPGIGCPEHREFEGDFVEDYRAHLALKKIAAAEHARLQLEEFPNGDQDDLDNHTPATVIDETTGIEIPQLRLYRLDDLYKIKHSVKTRSADSDARQRMKAICDDLIERGEYRAYARLPDPDAFEDLRRRFPNLSETIDVFRSSAALARLGNGALEVPPLLLVGPPGIGKTQVANEIAAMLDTDFLEIRMENEQNAASISGSSEFWGNTQTGHFFTVLTGGRTANPIVLLDELDKVGGDSRYNPAGGLYSLLERETAQRFEDQSIRGLKMDASAVIWIITANDLDLIPAPIRSRTMVQHIRQPTREESVLIAHSIYGSILKGRSWGNHFNPELGNDVAEKLSATEPRQMKVCLISAFGKAALASRNYICTGDIQVEETGMGRMGFL